MYYLFLLYNIRGNPNYLFINDNNKNNIKKL